jgi:hypothetical protein
VEAEEIALLSALPTEAAKPPIRELSQLEPEYQCGW